MILKIVNFFKLNVINLFTGVRYKDSEGRNYYKSHNIYWEPRWYSIIRLTLKKYKILYFGDRHYTASQISKIGDFIRHRIDIYDTDIYMIAVEASRVYEDIYHEDVDRVCEYVENWIFERYEWLVD